MAQLSCLAIFVITGGISLSVVGITLLVLQFHNYNKRAASDDDLNNNVPAVDPGSVTPSTGDDRDRVEIAELPHFERLVSEEKDAKPEGEKQTDQEDSNSNTDNDKLAENSLDEDNVKSNSVTPSTGDNRNTEEIAKESPPHVSEPENEKQEEQMNQNDGDGIRSSNVIFRRCRCNG